MAARRALAAVRAIGEDVLRIPPRLTRARRRSSGPAVSDASLAQGLAGLALFCGYLSRAGFGVRYERAARRFLGAALGAVESVTMGPSLYGGFAGVAWASAHLDRHVFGSEDRTSLEEVDDVLRDVVSRPGWTGDYDLIAGLVGLGVYALERLPAPGARACLEGVVDRLEERSRRRAGGVCWHTAPELLPPWQRQLCPSGYYNLGLAHGCPGVIVLLAAASGAGVRRETTGRLLDGAMAWLWSQRRRRKSGTRFSAWVAPGLPSEDCRSAWCYGDPGVAAALLVAARCVGNAACKRRAVELARRAARRPSIESGALDAGICHGAAGLAHLYNRMHQATGDPALARAARFWLLQTLGMRERDAGIGGFRALAAQEDGKKYWEVDPGLLTGATGIGLTLLAAATSDEPAWDRVLLLSAR